MDSENQQKTHQGEDCKKVVITKWNLDTQEMVRSIESKFNPHGWSKNCQVFDPNYQNLLNFERMNNQITITHDKQDYASQFYFNQELDHEKNYIVKFQFYRNDDRSDCSFGLIPKEYKDNEMVWSNMVIWYGDIYGGYTDKIVKGNKIHSEYKVQGKNLELRFNIQKSIWKIATVPDYQNVSELSKKIDDSEQYFLVFVLFGQSKVLITDISEVSEFDNQMDAQKQQ